MKPRTTVSTSLIDRLTTLASVGLALMGGAAVATILYFGYVYGVTREREFRSPWFAVVYLLLPAAIATAAFAARRLSPALRIQTCLVFVGTGAGIYATEFILQATGRLGPSLARGVMSEISDASDPVRVAKAASRKWGVPIDARTPVEVLQSLSTREDAAVPIITPANHLLLRTDDGRLRSAVTIDGQETVPLASASNRLTLLCNESGSWVHYRSDQHGFNNPPDEWGRAHLAIAAVGDSFAQGYCVDREESFVGLIRRRHPATLNLGMAGNGPLLMLAGLTEFLSERRPGIVLWCYFEGNDLQELQNEMANPILRRYLEDGFRQPSLRRQDEIDHAILAQLARVHEVDAKSRIEHLRLDPLSRVLAFGRLTSLRERLGLVGGVSRADLEVEGDDNLRTFARVLGEADRRVAAWGGTLVFVFLPDWGRYAGLEFPGRNSRSAVLDIARKLKIPILDVDMRFRAQQDPLSLFPFGGSGHYNIAGHRVVADQVLRYLDRSSPVREESALTNPQDRGGTTEP